MRPRELIRHGEVMGLIAVGGFLGANLRYVLGAVSGEALVMTLVVNAIGCFGLGLLLFDARADDLLSKRFRYVFGTGFFASFTTYSTFVADIALSQPVVGMAYLVGSYTAGFCAVLLSKAIVDRTATSTLRSPLSGED